MDKYDAVIVGGGPVGLWTALQLKKRNPTWNILIYERYETYQRSHVLRLDHWSLILYGRNSTKDTRQQQFFKEITGKSISSVYSQAAKSLYIRTNDLESSLKSYALDSGIEIKKELITDHQLLCQRHPECQYFIAADGAHSQLRESLLGKNSTQEHPLQHVIEIKYQVQGKVKKLELLDSHLKINQIMKHMAFEYIGKEKNGITPVTLRFFIDKKSYHDIPEASFKKPLQIDDERIPEDIKKDVRSYMAMRAQFSQELQCRDSAKMTKLILSMYSAKRFAVQINDQAWFLVGDCAMGVPYFRALNCGLILGSRLGQILSSKHMPGPDISKQVKWYNFHRPLHIATEFAIAKGKDWGLQFYDWFRQMSSQVVFQSSQQEQTSLLDKYQEQRFFGCENPQETHTKMKI